VHAKDGLYPTNGRELGQETPLGQGKVDFPRVLAHLKELGYDGALTIEREISGAQQIKDIMAAKILLEKILEELA
jgi:L-ribulose-5-phosphate 3-epimerase